MVIAKVIRIIVVSDIKVNNVTHNKFFVMKNSIKIGIVDNRLIKIL
jgi:hypothetical protein